METKVNKEGGEGGALVTGVKIHLQPMKTMMQKVIVLQPMESNSGADIHLQPVQDPMPKQVDGRWL